MGTVQFDPRDLIRPPFAVCPACGKDEFGVLSISRHSYTRRCRECWETRTSPLPVLSKILLYLDQFAISNMMKAINPQTKAKTDSMTSFWLDLFKRLDRLVKLQVLVCPDSPMQSDESSLPVYYKALKRMYEALSHGVSFAHPQTIKRFQVVQHAKWWIQGAEGDYQPTLEPRQVLSDPVDGWQERYILTVEFQIPPDSIDALRKHRNAVSEKVEELFSVWQKDVTGKFDDWYWKEIRAFGEPEFDSP